MHVGRRHVRECPGVFKRTIIMLQAGPLWIVRSTLAPKNLFSVCLDPSEMPEMQLCCSSTSSEKT